MFIELDPRKFFQTFQTEDDCRQFLYDIKWAKGFCCKRCGNSKCWTGRTKFHARCTVCDYDESVTANTALHKIKIPLLKVFSISFQMTALKKGASCRNISKLTDVGLKSVWLFRRKVQEVIAAWLSEEKHKLVQTKHCGIDGIILTHREKELNGLQQVKLILTKARSAHNRTFIRCITSETDPSEFDPCTLIEGRYVNEGKALPAWNFRIGLTGIHHHCSKKYLKGYLDEFCFRTNHSGKENRIWFTLISALMRAKPLCIKVNGV